MLDKIIQLMVSSQLSFYEVSATSLQQWLNSKMPLKTLIRRMPIEKLLPEESDASTLREIAPNATYNHHAAQRLPASHNAGYSYIRINQSHVERVQKSGEKYRREIQKSLEVASAMEKVDTSWYQSEGIQMTWGQFLEKINDGCRLEYYDEVDILKCSGLSQDKREIFNFLFARAKKENAPSLLQPIEIGVIERQAGLPSLYDIFRESIFIEKREPMGEGILFNRFRRTSLFYRRRGGPIQEYHDNLGATLIKDCCNLWEMIREVRAYKIFLSIEDQFIKQAGCVCIPKLHRNNKGTSPDENAKIYIGKLLEDSDNSSLLAFVNLLIDEKNNTTIVDRDTLERAKTCETDQRKVFSIVLDRLFEIKSALFYASQENPDWEYVFSSINDIIEQVSKKISSQIHTQEVLSMSIRERLKGFQIIFKYFLEGKPDLYDKLNLLAEFSHLKQFFETESFSDWLSTPPSAPPPPTYEASCYRL